MRTGTSGAHARADSAYSPASHTQIVCLVLVRAAPAIKVRSGWARRVCVWQRRAAALPPLVQQRSGAAALRSEGLSPTNLYSTAPLMHFVTWSWGLARRPRCICQWCGVVWCDGGCSLRVSL